MYPAVCLYPHEQDAKIIACARACPHGISCCERSYVRFLQHFKRGFLVLLCPPRSPHCLTAIMPGADGPSRKPIPLPSRQFSCSEIPDGQALLKRAKLEPSAMDERTSSLRQRLQAGAWRSCMRGGLQREIQISSSGNGS